MTTPSDQDLRRMLAEATQLPWTKSGTDVLQVHHTTRDVWYLPRSESDVALAVAAVNALPAHLAGWAGWKEGGWDVSRYRVERPRRINGGWRVAKAWCVTDPCEGISIRHDQSTIAVFDDGKTARAVCRCLNRRAQA